MKCGPCGGFYNPNCPRWPTCRPVPPEDDPIFRELKRANDLSFANGMIQTFVLAALLVLVFK